MAKTKDLFLNIVANPNMTLEDLANVGITSENTVLLDRVQYASNERVQKLFQDPNGNFDENKFNEWYDLAAQSYNILSNDEVNLNLMDVTAYDVDNIFVDPSKRRAQNEPQVIKLPNPDRLNTSLTRVGKVSQRTLSHDEIAQTQQVLLNPTEVANGAKPKYGKSPNESWFENFWETRVMASWDEDGTHIDPVTGQEVTHQKGDLKLNENGTYYYENLDGRSVYGKQVLNKFNTLTTDGSVWNKYDFFDSDDIEQKSIGGSITKNLALVGTMFIPYVGWGIAAASVAHQVAGLTATFGKMIAGSDNSTLNAIEGWVKSTDRRNLKTEYAQQNTWCWENFIDLIGDTTAQLREQRAIFKFAPGIIKRDFKALDSKKMKQFEDNLAKEYMQNYTNLSFTQLAKLAKQQNPTEWKKQFSLLMTGAKDIASTKAAKATRDYLNSYYKLGEPIARAYMTAITVQDTFGEAIEAGASDLEASLLTIGYAAMESALLRTDLGKWIMPELKADKQRSKIIAKKLLELSPETREMSKQISRLNGEAKKDWAKRLFNVGKNICKAEYATASKTFGSVLATGLGEGIEEVSEEALADFSKSCFNLVQQLQGDDVRLNAWNHNWDWSNAADRYGMSFFGGIIGGGINAAASDYKVHRDLSEMTSQQALQQLVYMTRNNELDDFWKTINKTTLGNKHLSTQLNDDGIGYKPGTKDDNQDLEAKNFIKKQVSLIESIINSEGAKLNDSGLLSALIKADPSLQDLDPVKEYRMRALSNSATAGRFLNEFNTIQSDIVKNRLEQNKIINKYGDISSEKYSEEDKQTLKQLGQSLKELQARKDGMLKGDRTREYVRDALFEMTHAVKEVWDDWCTEIRYAEFKSGKKYKDLSEPERKQYKEAYEGLKNSNQYAEQIHELANIYETVATSASAAIMESTKFYDDVKQQQYQNLVQMNKYTEQRLNTLLQILEDPNKGIEMLQNILNDDYKSELLSLSTSPELQDKINEIRLKTTTTIDAVLQDKTPDQLTEKDKEKINSAKHKEFINIRAELFEKTYQDLLNTSDEFLKAGFIHPETKNLLFQTLNALSKFSRMAQIREEDNASLNNVFEDFETKYYDLDKQIQTKRDQIDQLPNTPILNNIAQFQLSTSIDKSAVDLVTALIKKENDTSNEIDTFQLDANSEETFNQARRLLEMYRSTIVGARIDNIDIDSIVGFNVTLNELSGEHEQLATIDAQTCDLILEDINKLLLRLDYAQELNRINSGNKYNIQNKTALNKQFILFNKLKTFISILDEDGWSGQELDNFKAAIANATELENNSNTKYEDRNFSLSPNQKQKIDEESIHIQHALHELLNKHIDGNPQSIEKLSKLLTYDRFKGLIRPNTEYLDHRSVDIDDSAFIWWLCATAALDPNQFYNNYRQIINEETEGEKPIAPIPTHELGIFALTAAISNGNMFNTFGEAIRKSLINLWDTSDESIREKINNDFGRGLFYKDSDKEFFLNNDFLPYFDNILFIEGIAGSGKTKGVLVAWSKLMAKVNPDFIKQKVFFAHTSKEKAETLAELTTFENNEFYDHDSLLTYMSNQYVPMPTNTDGDIIYQFNKDVVLVDGVLRSNWEPNVYDINNVPKIIIIDEWSHYNQIEQELMQRFAQKYGTTIITMGDYDQLTPKAKITDVKQYPDGLTVTPDRNKTSRVAKFGVSMRTDNEIKNNNMYRMLAWKQKPESSIELHYYENENGIYGDKAYLIDKDFKDELTKIKLDVQKMINTLNPNEKIGYVFSDTTSELYKWLTETVGIAEHIQPFSDKDAHGREAQYYIIESNRKTEQDTLSYFESIYTGITRSEQGSIVIINPDKVKLPGKLDKYNQNGIFFKSVKDEEMLPNTFTDEGTRAFSKRRKNILDKIFADTPTIPFTIIPRTPKNISIIPDSTEVGTGNLTIPQVVQQTNVITPTFTENTENQIAPLASEELPTEQTGSDSQTLHSIQPIEEQSDIEQSTEEILTEEHPIIDNLPAERVQEPEEQPWIGPLVKNTKLYDKNTGECVCEIVGEKDDKYNVFYLQESITQFVDKSYIESEYSSVQLPQKLYQIGDIVSYTTNGKSNISEIVKIYFNNKWIYELKDGSIHTKQELTLVPKPEENYEIPDTPETFDSQQNFEELWNEAFSDTFEYEVPQNESDIDFNLQGFTFNTFYVGDNFDQNDNLKETDYDKLRIDNGYGISKITGKKSKSDILKTLGQIRRILEFKNNEQIVNNLQYILPNVGSIRWAFISKTEIDSPSGHRGKYGRYNLPKASLEYMFKPDTNIPIKTIAAIIYDKNNNPILEVPMISLLSPIVIFKQLNKLQNKSKLLNDILYIWNDPKSDLYFKLDTIIKKLKTGPYNTKGYQKLKTVLSAWLFTSNGIKLFDKTWNLSEKLSNLGNIYVTQRHSELRPEDDFEATWIDLATHQRSDRFISSILMHNTDKIDGLTLFRPYNPFVLISDDPDIDDDTKAVQRYIKQLQDPTLSKTVKIIPVSPPEISVTTYLKAMRDVLTGTTKNAPYGNIYTPYRIWNAILKDSIISQKVLSQLSEIHGTPQTSREFIIDTINKLNEIVINNPKTSSESNLMYKTRIAKAQNEILRQNTENGIVYERLRKYLIEAFYGQTFGSESYQKTESEEILNDIETTCNNAGITGILCKPRFASNQVGNGIEGIAYKVKVDDNNKYHFPGQGSYRIYGKIDPCTYDLNSQEFIDTLNNFMNNASLGVQIYTEQNVYNDYPNMWKFNDKSDENWYLPQDVITTFFRSSKKFEFDNLLGRLKLNEYNNIEQFCEKYNIRSNNYKSISHLTNHLIKLINEEYANINGNFIIKVNNKFKYGTIPDGSDLKFTNVEYLQGKIHLVFKNTKTNGDQIIEINNVTDSSFTYLSEKNSEEIVPTIKLEDLQHGLIELENNNLLKIKSDFSNIYFPKFKEIINNDSEILTKITQLEEYINNVVDEKYSTSKLNLKKKLHLLDQNTEMSKNTCVSPLTIPFK